MAPLARQLKGLVTIGASFLTPALNTGLTNSTISRVATNLLSTAEKSWELGTAAEALIELNAQSVSVFGENAFPPPRRLSRTDNLTDVRTMVDDVLAVKPATSKAFIDGQGSVADAASLGTAVLLANWTRADLTDDSYDIAASQQLDFLLKEAPRSEAGAISHRAEQVQLWSDYIYMVPPFLAYYGALQKDRELLQEAYDQVRIYRDALVDKESGLWKHIALGSWQDDKLWATGNAWAAAGALRVLQALNQSSEAREFKDQQADLTAWIGEITSAAWERQALSGAIHNVINDPATFTDSAATALLAASTYRLALFTKDSSQVESANKAFEFIKENINEDGWLEGTVDPYTFYEPSKNDIGQYSPEGQAFSLILHSAWRDYTQALKDEKKDEDRVGRN